MRRASGKRLPHGATSDLVLATLWRLHMHTGRPEPVSRADLVKAACLPETTVDDRLRVLLKQRQVMRVGRGLYSPIHRKGGDNFDRYWRHRVPPGWTPSPQNELDEVAQEAKPPGTRRTLVFPEGVVLIERWQSVSDYSRSESRRQRLEYFGEDGPESSGGDMLS